VRAIKTEIENIEISSYDAGDVTTLGVGLGDSKIIFVESAKLGKTIDEIIRNLCHMSRRVLRPIVTVFERVALTADEWTVEKDLRDYFNLRRDPSRQRR